MSINLIFFCYAAQDYPNVFNIGYSTHIYLIELISAIEYHLEKTAIREFLPMQHGDVYRTKADITDLAENLGYRPGTLVMTGIDKFVE